MSSESTRVTSSEVLTKVYKLLFHSCNKHHDQKQHRGEDGLFWLTVPAEIQSTTPEKAGMGSWLVILLYCSQVGERGGGGGDRGDGETKTERERDRNKKRDKDKEADRHTDMKR